MTPHSPTPYSPPPGLCESCANVKVIDTRKGSRFFLCELSEVDPRFPRYPRIPVLRCHGYTPVPEPPASPMDDVSIREEVEG